MRVLALGCVVCFVGGCGQPDKYASAGIAAGIAVAAAGVNRAATDDCWAACQPGEACDHDRGICVRIACRADCPPTHRCVESPRGDRCERITPESSLPPDLDAGAPGAEPATTAEAHEEEAPVDAGAAAPEPPPLDPNEYGPPPATLP